MNLGALPLLWALLLATGCDKMRGDSSKSSAAPTPNSKTTGELPPKDPTPEPTTVLIGEYGSLTGSEATFGQSTHNGIILGLEEQNTQGGVKGKKVELKTYDDQGKTQEAGTAVTRLINDDKVVAIIGEVASSLSLAGGAVAQKYGVPMVSPSSTNMRVTMVGDKIFRVCFIDQFQGYVVAKFARENLKTAKVAVLYDQASAYSKGLKDDFKKAFVDIGGQVPTEQAYDAGATDFSAQLTSIRATNPDAIFLPGYYTDVGNIAVQARKLGIKVPFLGGDGWDSAKLAEIGGAAIEGSYYSNHYSHEEQRPEVQEFVRKYSAKFGQVPDGLAALGYDAAKILFHAIERSPSLSGADIALALAQTKDFHGVTGIITIDKDRNAQKPAVMLQVKGGKPTYVATIEPSK
ncbi:MAG: ABC transporter substrate-binding protein [Deltaproteobacteria bacterium]|nr:ABC transporter substrate-binding protein [Deltaproteobacteria bacterium]